MDIWVVKIRIFNFNLSIKFNEVILHKKKESKYKNLTKKIFQNFFQTFEKKKLYSQGWIFSKKKFLILLLFFIQNNLIKLNLKIKIENSNFNIPKK